MRAIGVVIVVSTSSQPQKMRSPSAVGSALVVTSLVVLVAPLISCVLHFLHDVPLISIPLTSWMNSSFNLQFEAMATFPRIVASGFVMYVGACLHCVGREFLKEEVVFKAQNYNKKF